MKSKTEDEFKTGVYKKLNRKYIFAFFILLIIIILRQIIIQYQINQDENWSRIINVAGRQRMLSQKIVKDFYIIKLKSEENSDISNYVTEAQEAIILWESSHNALLYGDEQMGIIENNSNRVHAMFHEIDPAYQAILHTSKELLRVIKQDSNDLKVMDGIIGTITANEKAYLDKMDQIVDQYDVEAARSIHRLEKAEIYLFYILLLVMILKLLTVIIPAAKTLKSTLSDLTDSYNNINKLFRTIRGAQFLVKHDGEIILMNSDAEKLINTDNMAGKNLNVAKNIKWVTINILNLIEKLEKEETVESVEAEVEDRNGNHLCLITSAMRSDFKKQNVVLLSMYDITLRKTAEKELKEMAIRDKLTGLYNRTFMDTIIAEEIERSERYEIPLSAFILDLDRFKNVNDKWGHPIGDSVLKMTADIIQNNIRTSDYALRIGGEEFVVLLPHTAIEGAFVAAEKVRKAIEDSIHPVVGKFTASFGVAERNSGETFRLMYNRMDSALYNAKEAGRNCVIQAVRNSEGYRYVLQDWKNSWNSGERKIDEQHQELFQLLSGLKNDVSLEERDKILSLIDQIIKLLREHFIYEEEILNYSKYEDLLNHKGIHNKLMAKVIEIRKSIEEGKRTSISAFNFLFEEVIIDHLFREDVKYFPLLNNSFQN